ncbi:MAG: hypothetical protein PHZ04_01935 [Patescibacteria group bacterium]|nr:hypothetical protein [Patescibacteria group bacterium]MDD5294512.1 hypothetical protein [Patescibacteria group bacterium]MDD5555017.1 hypothetical protein [Patescibacteria group bacterium]
MDKSILKNKLKIQLKNFAWRAITTVILTLVAVATVLVYAAFTEPLVGPNDSDQDFLQNILGADNNNNDFSSSNVASNVDGSIIERQEYIQTGIGTSTDAASMSATLFAGQEAIYGQVDNSYSACYTIGQYCGYKTCSSYPSCLGGWTSLGNFTTRGGCYTNINDCEINSWNVCCLPR